MHVTVEESPRVLATRTPSTSSPSAEFGPPPALAIKGNVTLAVRTFVWVREMLMLAAQVELACVRSSRVHVSVAWSRKIDR